MSLHKNLLQKGYKITREFFKIIYLSLKARHFSNYPIIFTDHQKVLQNVSILLPSISSVCASHFHIFIFDKWFFTSYCGRRAKNFFQIPPPTHNFDENMTSMNFKLFCHARYNNQKEQADKVLLLLKTTWVERGFK